MVRFNHAKQDYHAPVTNLSAGGCCIRIAPHEALLLERGTPISMLRLMHPEIPSVPLQGRVCWIMGKRTEVQDGFSLVGIEFINPSPNFMALLEGYVTGLLADNG